MFPTFEIFGFTVGMYGITTVIGAAICVIVGLKLIKKFKIMWEDFALVMIVLAISLFIFAHIVYGITNLDKLAIIFTNLGKLSFEQLIALLGESLGGMVFYGGFIGGVIGIL
ncbi:MAG: prolipoprotein diacylglyceryl transferase, partial [Ruminococcus sp.]|nr:prolipoprotein diacylglyceryl transferase [Ruminococcus sp.]